VHQSCGPEEKLCSKGSRTCRHGILLTGNSFTTYCMFELIRISRVGRLRSGHWLHRYQRFRPVAHHYPPFPILVPRSHHSSD